MIQVKNHESKDALPLEFINEKDLTDEQREQLKDMIGVVLIKEKTIYKNEIPDNFTLTHTELINLIKEKYPYIRINKYFNKIKNYLKIKHNKTLVYEWINNPKSKKSKYTYCYDEKIIDEFAKMCPPITPATEPIVSQI